MTIYPRKIKSFLSLFNGEDPDKDNATDNGIDLEDAYVDKADTYVDDGIDGILADDNFEEDESQATSFEDDEDLIQEDKTSFDNEGLLEDEPQIPEFDNVLRAAAWAISNRKVMKITYVTQGKKGRGGIKLKRERGVVNPGGGYTIWRIIEPTYIFKAKNGNTILVSYDRSVRHIRAFILNNIIHFDFTGKNYKDRKFFNKKYIGNMDMKKKVVPTEIKDNVNVISRSLEKKGLDKVAYAVRDTFDSFKKMKTAQYIGWQGYAIRNRRCWDNCYRHKRTASPDKPIQVVWEECWSEYRDHINSSPSEEKWSKYASSTGKNSDKNFNKNMKFDKKMVSGMSKRIARGESVKSAMKKEVNSFEADNNDFLKKVSSLSVLAESLFNAGFVKEAKNLSDVSVSMIRHAGWTQNLMNWGKEKLAPVWNVFNQMKDLTKKINNLQMAITNNFYTQTKRPAQPAQPAQPGQASQPQGKQPIKSQPPVNPSLSPTQSVDLGGTQASVFNLKRFKESSFQKKSQEDVAVPQNFAKQYAMLINEAKGFLNSLSSMGRSKNQEVQRIVQMTVPPLAKSISDAEQIIMSKNLRASNTIKSLEQIANVLLTARSNVDMSEIQKEESSNQEGQQPANPSQQQQQQQQQGVQNNQQDAASKKLFNDILSLSDKDRKDLFRLLNSNFARGQSPQQPTQQTATPPAGQAQPAASQAQGAMR